MAASGFSLEKGASTPNVNQAGTKKLMIPIAARVILLFGSSKMGHNSFAIFAPLERIDAVIADSLCEEKRQQMEESGIEPILAGFGGAAFDGGTGPTRT
ncbi:MAG: hypothetical protein ABSG21_08845 [Spirochaetia bacterium]|jgi:DeoR family fructose operon transcriptional repressor